MQLQKATRKKVKIRMSIASPTGFGKTFSALQLAFGITGDWNKIAVIDTENESASLYSHLGDFYTIPLAPPFTPDKYLQAIKVCEDGGIEVIIIDSVTHVWSGQGGLLEFQTSLGGRYQDWAKTTPLYQKWLNTILHSKAHIITTMRKKQAYTMSTENGKTKVEKAGMEDQIRDGYDYEMTIAFELVNDNHLAKAAKDRTGLFMNKTEFVITPQTGKLIKDWCETGIEATALVDPREELTPTHPAWKAVVDALQQNYTISQVETKYRITNGALAALQEVIANKNRVQEQPPAAAPTIQQPATTDVF